MHARKDILEDKIRVTLTDVIVAEPSLFHTSNGTHQQSGRFMEDDTGWQPAELAVMQSGQPGPPDWPSPIDPDPALALVGEVDPMTWTLDQFNVLLTPRRLRTYKFLKEFSVFAGVQEVDTAFAVIARTLIATLGREPFQHCCGNCQTLVLKELAAMVQRRMGVGFQYGVLLFYLWGCERMRAAGVSAKQMFGARVTRLDRVIRQFTALAPTGEALHNGHCRVHQRQQWFEAAWHAAQQAADDDELGIRGDTDNATTVAGDGESADSPPSLDDFVSSGLVQV